MNALIKESVLRIIKLLVYYAAYQLLFTTLAMFVLQAYHEVWALAVGLLLSSSFMLWHLLHFGYFRFSAKPFGQVGNNVMLLTIMFVFACMWVFNIFAQWFELSDKFAEQMNELSNNVIGIFSLAVLAPLLEEVLFRGAIQGYLMRRFNPWIAIVTASLIFGLVHMNPIQIFYATCIGFALGWIYYRTRSLMPVIIGHILNNSIAALTLLLAKDENAMDMATSSEVAIVVFGALAALLLAFLIERKSPPLPKPWCEVGEEVTSSNL